MVDGMKILQQRVIERCVYANFGLDCNEVSFEILMNRIKRENMLNYFTVSGPLYTMREHIMIHVYTSCFTVISYVGPARGHIIF